MKKALFFDVDGTVMGADKEVSKSTIEAIKKARENGHLAFVCTGRARVMIPENPVLQIGFDGIIAACGMYGEYDNKIIYEKELEKEFLDKTLKELEKRNAVVILEGNRNIYYDTQSQKKRGKHRIEYLIEKELPGKILPIDENRDNLRVSKWTCIANEEEADEIFEEFAKEYDVMRHEELVAEFVEKGYSKATGIAKMCEYLGIAMEDTIAFGDSVNDEDMLKACGIGIAMGNGSEIAKESADYITDSIENNGIYNACMHFKLI